MTTATIETEVLNTYWIWLFINGRQTGNNMTFREFYETDAAAEKDVREYFTGEGFEVESITFSNEKVSPISPTESNVITVQLNKARN